MTRGSADKAADASGTTQGLRRRRATTSRTVISRCRVSKQRVTRLHSVRTESPSSGPGTDVCTDPVWTWAADKLDIMQSRDVEMRSRNILTCSLSCEQGCMRYSKVNFSSNVVMWSSKRHRQMFPPRQEKLQATNCTVLQPT